MGHWKGDPQCPEVKAGRVPLFKGHSKKDGDTHKKKPNSIGGLVSNWVGTAHNKPNDKRVASPKVVPSKVVPPRVVPPVKTHPVINWFRMLMTKW